MPARCAKCSACTPTTMIPACRSKSPAFNRSAPSRSSGSSPRAARSHSAAGWRSRVTLDDDSFEGVGVFVLGAVLEQFFAKYVSINSFTETVLRTVQRQEVMRWPTRIGRRHIL